MDYRRLIKFGNSSYVVSVPKDWLRKNHLEKGDMVYLSENGNNEILLSPRMEEKEPEPLIYSVEIDTLDFRDIERRVLSKYIAGYDVFTFSGEKTLREKQEDLRNLLNNLMALEIVEQTKTKIVAKDFLNPSEISFKMMVRRMDTILRSMFEDLKTVALEEDALELIRRDNDINRLCYLTLRTIRKCVTRPALAKKLSVSVENLFFYREFAEYLERIADEIKRMSRSLIASRLSSNQLKDFFVLFEDVHKIYIETMKAHYNQDESLAYELAKQREVLLEKCVALVQKYGDPSIYLAIERLKTIIVLIRNILRIIYRG